MNVTEAPTERVAYPARLTNMTVVICRVGKGSALVWNTTTQMFEQRRDATASETLSA